MDIAAFLKDKAIKPKEKTEAISGLLLDKKIPIDEITDIAAYLKDAEKATCIEAIEFATKSDPGIATEKTFSFVTAALTEKAPRIKWESARVIANTAHLFPRKLDKAISNLLANTGDKGTVVRWSAAGALGQILMLKTNHNKELLPAIETIIKREEKNSIKKIYLAAIKKAIR
jgi:hypothetical protein